MTATLRPLAAVAAELDAHVAALRARTTGDVLTPADDAYAAEVAPWNVAARQRPAVAVVAADAHDVVEAMRFANQHGLGLGVQSTGHGMVHAADGGVLVLTRRLDQVSVDPTSRTAWVGAGATWRPVVDAAAPHGLAPLVGSSTHVGAVGYTLGGGVGWLARKHGTSADSVRRFEVVLPTGTLVEASDDEHRDLFWALRGGGGGSLGVVVGMEVDLHPVVTIYGGCLLYPATQAAEVLAAYADWAPSTPEELTSAVVLMNFPPIDAVPMPLRGGSFVVVRACWCGPVADGVAVVDQLRAVVAPAMDTCRAMSFEEIDTIANDPVEPMPARGTGAFLARFDAHVAGVLAARTFPTDGPPPVVFSEVRHVGGGALGRGRTDGGSLGDRTSPWMFHAIALTPTVEAYEVAGAFHRQTAAELAPALSGSVFLNLCDGTERAERTRDAFDAAAYERLTKVKADVDPLGTMCFGVDHG